jgi:apolipoprotein N-acyltransferase
MRRSLLLSAAGGALEGACWLPLGFGFLMPFPAAMAMRGLRGARTGRQALLLGLVNGAARYGVASHFLIELADYSLGLGLAVYLMAVVSILPYSMLEAWGAFRLERRFRLPRVVGFALLWTLFEKARTLGDLSFPADNLPLGIGTYPAFLAWQPWIGPVGFTALVFGSALLLDRAVELRARRGPALAVAAAGLLLWLGPVITDPLLRSTPASGTMTVGIVQPWVQVEEKLQRDRWPGLSERVERLTERAARGADLVVWPETTRPGPIVWRGDGPFADPQTQALADRVGVPILYGGEVARLSDDGRILGLYNGAALVVPGRPDLAEWYGKQHLLPFIEGMPFGDLFRWDPAKRRSDPGKPSPLSLLGNYSRGPKPTIFQVGDARIGVMICYEGMYHELGRRYRNAGANMLAVLTNDAWWGDGVFAPWHSRMIAAQARALDLPVVRAANNGISSSVMPDGRHGQRTKRGEVTTLQVPVAPSTSPPTFFARNGNLVPWLLIAFLALWIVRVAVFRR